MKKQFLVLLALILAFEVLSAVVVFHPIVQSVIAVAMAIGLFVLTLKRPTLAFGVLASEYILGSKGYLFRFELTGDPNRGLSIRILFFAAFCLGWLVLAIRSGWWKKWPEYLNGRSAYVVLAVLLLFALVRALLLKNAFALADANAWGVLLLVLPILDIAKHHGLSKHEREELLLVGFAALLVSALETVGIFYFFSHGFPVEWTDFVYHWIRFTGVGEITRILPGQNAFRIFFQSHIYELLAYVGLLLAWSPTKQPRQWLCLSLLIGVILISFSRSFWIGLVAMGVFVAIGLGIPDLHFVASGMRRGWLERFESIWKIGLLALGTGLIGTLMAAGLYLFPFPGGGSANFADLVLARASTGDDASQSRWSLLPILWQKIKQAPILGSGFGATVTYTSHDPRVVQRSGGQYTTYAFEWGWVDFWLKFGILGIPVMLFFLFQMGWRIWKSVYPYRVRLGMVAVLVGLAVVHFFTPYLNHPLGFMVLLTFEGCLALRPAVTA